MLLTGCATLSERPGFDDVQAEIQERAGHRVHWSTGTAEDQLTAQVIRDLLAHALTADQAVQVALLNNRRLQATFKELGVAQADLVQAGLLRNPIFSAEVLFPLAGGPVELELGVAQSFLEILVIPLRQRVARSQFEEAKLNVTAAVLEMAYDTRVAFYEATAASQRVEMFEQIQLATELGYDFARRLHEAGNITDLALAQQQDLFDAAKLDVVRAQATLLSRRETLNRLMGLSGDDTQWQINGRLPDVPEDGPELAHLESQVMEQSLDLAMARQRILTAGRQLGITDATRLVPSLELGVDAERNGSWAIGPTFSLPIPLFDQGQARLARNRSELRRQQETYASLAVELQSVAREAQHQFAAARQVAHHYQQVILPLRQQIVDDMQLQYNAMQVGLFELVRARERQIEAGSRYIDALADYWIARARINHLLSGGI